MKINVYSGLYLKQTLDFLDYTFYSKLSFHLKLIFPAYMSIQPVKTYRGCKFVNGTNCLLMSQSLIASSSQSFHKLTCFVSPPSSCASTPSYFFVFFFQTWPVPRPSLLVFPSSCVSLLFSSFICRRQPHHVPCIPLPAWLSQRVFPSRRDLDSSLQTATNTPPPPTPTSSPPNPRGI